MSTSCLIGCVQKDRRSSFVTGCDRVAFGKFGASAPESDLGVHPTAEAKAMRETLRRAEWEPAEAEALLAAARPEAAEAEARPRGAPSIIAGAGEDAPAQASFAAEGRNSQQSLQRAKIKQLGLPRGEWSEERTWAFEFGLNARDDAF